MREYEKTCGVCGFEGRGNGNPPPRCPACGKEWYHVVGTSSVISAVSAR
jgi:hypothetical protein